MAFNVTGHSFGRAIGAFLAPFIYRQLGFLFVALLAVVFNLFGLLALGRLQKDGNAR
jgi:predicted MFS family arabinose efflux permease